MPPKKKTEKTPADHAELDAVQAQLEEVRAKVTGGAAAEAAGVDPAVIITIVEAVISLIRQWRNR